MHVNLRFAGQMKDWVLDYLMDRPFQIQHLQLDATNLVSDACWRLLFQRFGPTLQTLKLSNLDSSFDDDTVEELAQSCVALRQLKLTQCWKLGDRSVRAISGLKNLEQLSLNLVQEPETDSLLATVDNVGPNLRTLSLEGFPGVDDRVLQRIHGQCRHLSKLRFTDNAVCTDKGFAELFRDWANPPLEWVDLSSTRDVDKTNADGPTEPIGLASQGLIALMEHSGAKLRKLNISSCRHVSHEAFEAVFSEDKRYPQLQEIDVSFHMAMDDYLVGCIFRSCPAIKKLVAFACFKIQGAPVPVGVALIGGLKAQDPIIVEGESKDHAAI